VRASAACADVPVRGVVAPTGRHGAFQGRASCSSAAKPAAPAGEAPPSSLTAALGSRVVDPPGSPAEDAGRRRLARRAGAVARRSGGVSGALDGGPHATRPPGVRSSDATPEERPPSGLSWSRVTPLSRRRRRPLATSRTLPPSQVRASRFLVAGTTPRTLDGGTGTGSDRCSTRSRPCVGAPCAASGWCPVRRGCRWCWPTSSRISRT
jgi:hypothetical protein